MITSTSLSEKYRASFSDGTHECFTDTVKQYGGAHAGFKPTELLEAALAGCINTVLRIAADKRGIPLTGAVVQVAMNTENKAETVFEYAIEFEGDLTDEQREQLLRAVSGCPVKKILSGAVSFKEKSE